MSNRKTNTKPAAPVAPAVAPVPPNAAQSQMSVTDMAARLQSEINRNSMRMSDMLEQADRVIGSLSKKLADANAALLELGGKPIE
jgi:hypothetical protein